MSGYADSEKIQYALKPALYRTMQTSMSDSASVERSAPLRVFPTNIMKVNIIEAGKGDIGEDGLYVTGHTTAGQTADLSDPESTVKNYKIICPVNNVITSIEPCCRHLCRHRITNSITYPLTKRSSGSFNTRGFAKLWVARGFRMQLAEVLQVV